MTIEQILTKAEQSGINRREIGVLMYGHNQYSRIYRLENPTQRTIDRVKNAIAELKKQKKAKK